MSQIVQREIWSVTDLVTYVYQSLDQDEKLKRVWLEAEISNFIQNNRSKHMYFTLKDDYAKVKSAMFAGNNRRLRFVPKDGDRVLVRGYLSLYDREGQIQFYIQDMRLSGAGDLFIALERLKEMLSLEGLFSKPKKNIPIFPRKIGVVTSLSGAALHDILTTTKRRFPMTPILVIPVSVQGDHASSEISTAIDMMNTRNEVDVLIVGRGGGSLEEIWAFNEEVVARSIDRSNIPIISAVGHETDVTISDLVADIRAATPTAAAEMVTPHQQEISERVLGLQKRLLNAQIACIARHKNRLSQVLQRPVLEQPGTQLLQYKQRLSNLRSNLAQTTKSNLVYLRSLIKQSYIRLEYHRPNKCISIYNDKLNNLVNESFLHTTNLINKRRTRFNHLVGKLDALSPLKVMRRGYSLVYNEKHKLITSKDEVKKDDVIKVRFNVGQIKCLVIESEDSK